VAEALLTQFRRFVAATLEPALGVRLEPGKIDGPIERVAAGCIWSEGVQEVPEQVDDQLLVVMVRVFNPNRRRRAGRKPPPDQLTALEELAELVQTTMRDVQTQGGPWFNRVTACEIDPDLNMVEVTIVARSANLGVLP
jgi:hypothetical protein